MQAPARNLQTNSTSIRRDCFAPKRASRVIKFVSSLYKSIGLTLPRFQKRLIAKLYGNCDERGLRRYRRCYYSTPRKNAKSTLAAALCLYHLFADGEDRPRIYLAATVLEQTAETFDIIIAMCAANPQLDRQTKIIDSDNRKRVIRIVNGKRRGFIASLTSRGSKEGKNPSLVIFDEFCDWRELHRPLYKSMTMGSFARKQPLFLFTTTAGDDEAILCQEQYSYAKRVMSGAVKDKRYLPYIIECSDPEKWDDIDELVRINPLVAEGFVDISAIETDLSAAQIGAVELAAFKNKRCNLWVGSSVAYLDMAKWEATKLELDDEELYALPCVLGLDLANTDDFCALVAVFWDAEAEVCHVRAWFWIPEVGLKRRESESEKPIGEWVEAEYIDYGGVETVHYDKIFAKIEALSKVLNVSEVGFDAWGAKDLVDRIENIGLECVPVGQGYKSLSRPMKMLRDLVLNKKLAHANNPVLSWMAGNLNAKMDEGGNVKPMKRKRSRKIDGMSALLDALFVLSVTEGGKYQSALAQLMTPNPASPDPDAV
jgi:phage terminase large subunit-like protein